MTLLQHRKHWVFFSRGQHSDANTKYKALSLVFMRRYMEAFSFFGWKHTVTAEMKTNQLSKDNMGAEPTKMKWVLGFKNPILFEV